MKPDSKSPTSERMTPQPRRLILSAVLAVAIAGSSAIATASPAPRRTVAGVTRSPRPVLIDRVAVIAVRDMSTPLVNASIAAATQVDARSTVVHAGTLDLRSIHRGPDLLDYRPPPQVTPLSALAVDATAATALYGTEVGAALTAGKVVLSKTSAALRQARVGDALGVAGWSGGMAWLSVGAVVADERTDFAEVMLSLDTATVAGFDRPNRVLIWGVDGSKQRNRLERALQQRLPRYESWRVRRTWDPANIDAVLPQATLKTMLGEFSVVRGADGALSIDDSWTRQNIARQTLPIIGPMMCHKKVLAAAYAALKQIDDSGLADLIDPFDTRHNGGCFFPRELRAFTGTSGGSLSRHSWGAALDINPSANRYGAKPTIDPRIVDIFRQHGFAWGGSFIIPDGMHFEFTGDIRVPYTDWTVRTPVPAIGPWWASSSSWTPSTWWLPPTWTAPPPEPVPSPPTVSASGTNR